MFFLNDSIKVYNFFLKKYIVKENLKVVQNVTIEHDQSVLELSNKEIDIQIDKNYSDRLEEKLEKVHFRLLKALYSRNLKKSSTDV